jgi:hypothetical protein
MKEKIYTSGICLGLFLIGFILVYQNKLLVSDQPYRLQYIVDGKYLKLVFIGSSDCVFSNNDEMHSITLNIKKHLSELTRASNMKLMTTGITSDVNADIGYSYLQKTGPYTEIYTGASWYNLGLKRYIWKDFEAPSLTPQLLITLAEKNSFDAGGQLANVNIDEIIVIRLIGFHEIQEFHNKLQYYQSDELATLLKLY